MKIKPNHYEVLKINIEAILEKLNADNKLVESYESGNFRNSEKTKDLQKRFCFDLLHACKLNSFVCNDLYPYLNDSHIYTALKKICPKVERKY